MGHAREETQARPLGLVRYDAACRALALAKSVDEVKQIRGASSALRAYAKQAKNRRLEIDAVEIRIRAERRVGELMDAQRETVGLNKGGRTGGKNPPVMNSSPTLADAGIDKDLAKRARQLAVVPEKKFEQLLEGWRDRTEHDGERVTAELLKPIKLAVHHSSETPEHYTPSSFLQLVNAVFSGIPDLDPCSNSATAPNVPARRHYTIDDDGLQQPWAGRVFLNPPYGREIGAWTEKVRHEFDRGAVSELIALLPARPDTEWFNNLTLDTDDAVLCFLHGRLVFIGNTDPAPFPSLVIYFGPAHDRFASVFAPEGSLWQRPSRPLEWFVNHE